MISRIIYFSMIFFLVSCKKQEDQPLQFTQVQYRVSITGNWQSPQFSVPSNVHFTTFTGMVHNSNTFLWRKETLASAGVENVAEIGDRTAILNEIGANLNNKNALVAISIIAPGATGNSVDTISCNSNYTLVSFESMIAPSPDWFTGISELNLFNNKQWVADTTIHLYVYDAGTEEGDVFAYDNPATIPQETVHLLTSELGMALANGNPVLSNIATVRFTRL
ncbi:MAG: spondin domain-containing protein [Ginsengibacter sp.]